MKKRHLKTLNGKMEIMSKEHHESHPSDIMYSDIETRKVLKEKT